jgi:hypothetical protein
MPSRVIPDQLAETRGITKTLITLERNKLGNNFSYNKRYLAIEKSLEIAPEYPLQHVLNPLHPIVCLEELLIK